MAEMKETRNKKELKSFLGFLWYLSMFLYDLAQIAVAFEKQKKEKTGIGLKCKAKHLRRPKVW